LFSGETLLKLQKRFVGLIAGKGGCYYADPPFSGYGVLKVGDLYSQQLRLHAWKFCNGRLPDGQMATLRRVNESHGYGTRSARSSLVVGSGNHRLVAYRVPAEWRTLTVEQRGMRSVGGFKRSSKGDFFVQYELFQCRVPGCWVCGARSAGDGDLEG
jgi:hypothetical protein